MVRKANVSTLKKMSVRELDARWGNLEQEAKRISRKLINMGDYGTYLPNLKPTRKQTKEIKDLKARLRKINAESLKVESIANNKRRKKR